MEIEFGPAGYLRTERQSWLVAPAAIANLGIANGWELVLEGKQLWRLGSATLAPPADTSRVVITDSALSVKHVLVDGILQGRARPGLACEVSALLPALHEEGGFGAAAAVILSSRAGPVVSHLNLQAIFSRTHEPGGFLGLIVEGPQRWPVRPVLELAGERERGGTGTLSALAGFIWTACRTETHRGNCRRIVGGCAASVGAISSGNSANIGSSRQNFRPSSHRDGVHRRGTQPVSPFVRQLRVMTLCRILKIGPWRHVPSGIHHHDMTRPIVIVLCSPDYRRAASPPRMA